MAYAISLSDSIVFQGRSCSFQNKYWKNVVEEEVRGTKEQISTKKKNQVDKQIISNLHSTILDRSINLPEVHFWLGNIIRNSLAVNNPTTQIYCDSFTLQFEQWLSLAERR